MLPPGPERMRRIRHAGAKHIEDALMIPATLPALVTVARAATSLPWLLAGSLAASCWMESRATTVIEVLVPDEAVREKLLSRVGAMPQGHEVRIRVPDELDLTSRIVTGWYARARPDRVEDAVVFVPRPEDLFLLLLAERDVVEAPQAMYWACRLHLLHGPWIFDDVDLSAYQQERLGEAAVKIINHAAEELERLHLALPEHI